MANVQIEHVDMGLSISELVLEMLSGSWRDWEQGDTWLTSDLSVILRHFAERKYSAQNLSSSIVSLLWLILNVSRAYPRNGDKLWTTFIQMLENFCIDYRGVCGADDYNNMKQIVNSCLDGFENSAPTVNQSVPHEEDALTYLMENASQNFKRFESMLKSIDPSARCNLKAEARVREKAELEEKEGGYDGDYTRVLDYLRGTIYIDVYPETTNLRDIVEKVLRRLQRDLGSTRRVKVFKAEDQIPLPRILLNLDFKGLVSEVQVRFRLWGMDNVYQDFVHELYELNRKPVLHVNAQSHLVTLIREMLGKLRFEVNEDTMEWIRMCTKVQFKQLEDEKLPDKERVLLVIIEANDGLKKLEIRVKTAIEQDEEGFFVPVPSHIANPTDKFLVCVKEFSVTDISK
eukprot:TRINITY_DN129_c0_g1_i12.p1 TRINITY_DN129_c0_g1~~TRINITY_DN129_c0_g1_i12.p1  ORF type:complete len:402 (-),score=106.29 TRINITY_DN129_c0_g1_i12:75-1280(-)